jgi:ribose-phosphate pyrophosphokinase
MINLHDIPVANFPDGHKHLIVPPDFEHFYTTSIRASIRNFDDLFLLAQATHILPNLKHLSIVYLLAARCDREFSVGEAFDLEIVCSFINTLNFKTVTVLKPHSPVTLELLRTSAEDDMTDTLIGKCIEDFGLIKYAIVSPDKGASLWVGKYAQHFLRPLVQCDKKRDEMAEHHHVMEMVVPELPADCEDYIIVDDLCDGGGTFLALAAKLRGRGAKRVFLVVTHAIMSKGFVAVHRDTDGELYKVDQTAWIEVRNCEFETVFLDGTLIKEYTLSEIRERLANERPHQNTESHE